MPQSSLASPVSAERCRRLRTPDATTGSIPTSRIRWIDSATSKERRSECIVSAQTQIQEIRSWLTPYALFY